MAEAPKVRLSIRRLPQTDEWRVSYFENNRLNDDKSYYTNDREDAYATRTAMAAKLKAQGIAVALDPHQIGRTMDESDLAPEPEEEGEASELQTPNSKLQTPPRRGASGFYPPTCAPTRWRIF